MRRRFNNPPSEKVFLSASLQQTCLDEKKNQNSCVHWEKLVYEAFCYL